MTVEEHVPHFLRAVGVALIVQLGQAQPHLGQAYDTDEDRRVRSWQEHAGRAPRSGEVLVDVLQWRFF